MNRLSLSPNVFHTTAFYPSDCSETKSAANHLRFGQIDSFEKDMLNETVATGILPYLGEVKYSWQLNPEGDKALDSTPEEALESGMLIKLLDILCVSREDNGHMKTTIAMTPTPPEPDGTQRFMFQCIDYSGKYADPNPEDVDRPEGINALDQNNPGILPPEESDEILEKAFERDCIAIVNRFLQEKCDLQRVSED